MTFNSSKLPASHSFIVLSILPVKKYVPAGLNSIELMVNIWATIDLNNWKPSCIFHIFKCASLPPLNRNFPSGSIFRIKTELLCAIQTFFSCRSFKSITRIQLSLYPATIISPIISIDRTLAEDSLILWTTFIELKSTRMISPFPVATNRYLLWVLISKIAASVNCKDPVSFFSFRSKIWMPS